MTIKRIVTAGVGLGLVAMLTAACATLGGAAVGAGVGAAAGTIYGVTRH
jgi:hypothetical protein